MTFVVPKFDQTQATYCCKIWQFMRCQFVLMFLLVCKKHIYNPFKVWYKWSIKDPEWKDLKDISHKETTNLYTHYVQLTRVIVRNKFSMLQGILIMLCNEQWCLGLPVLTLKLVLTMSCGEEYKLNWLGNWSKRIKCCMDCPSPWQQPIRLSNTTKLSTTLIILFFSTFLYCCLWNNRKNNKHNMIWMSSYFSGLETCLSLLNLHCIKTARLATEPYFILTIK